jgi:uncharacterized OB-fold protein
MQENAAAFYKLLSSGKLWLQYCESCSKYVFYQRSLCPYCFKSELEWRETSGLGKVYSYTKINYTNLPEKKEQVPYIYAIVDLEEGIRLATNITDCDPADVYTGMPVKLTVKKHQNSHLHYFKPMDKPL